MILLKEYSEEIYAESNPITEYHLFETEEMKNKFVKKWNEHFESYGEGSNVIKKAEDHYKVGKWEYWLDEMEIEFTTVD